MKTKLLASLITALLVTGCGGGSNMDDKNKKTSKSNPTTPSKPSSPSSPDTNTGGDKDDGKGSDGDSGGSPDAGATKQLKLRVVARNVCGEEYPLTGDNEVARLVLHDDNWSVLGSNTSPTTPKTDSTSNSLDAPTINANSIKKVDKDGYVTFDIKGKETVNISIQAVATELSLERGETSELNIVSYQDVPVKDLGTFKLDIDYFKKEDDLSIKGCDCKKINFKANITGSPASLPFYGTGINDGKFRRQVVETSTADAHQWNGVLVCKEGSKGDAKYPAISTQYNGKLYSVIDLNEQIAAHSEETTQTILLTENTDTLIEEVNVADIQFRLTSNAHVTHAQRPMSRVGEPLIDRFRIENLRVEKDAQSNNNFKYENFTPRNYSSTYTKADLYKGIVNDVGTPGERKIVAITPLQKSQLLHDVEIKHCAAYNGTSDKCSSGFPAFSSTKMRQLSKPLADNMVYTSVYTIEDINMLRIKEKPDFEKEQYRYFHGVEIEKNSTTKPEELQFTYHEPRLKPVLTNALSYLRDNDDYSFQYLGNIGGEYAKISAEYRFIEGGKRVSWNHYGELTAKMPNFTALLTSTVHYKDFEPVTHPGQNIPTAQKPDDATNSALTFMDIDVFNFKLNKPESLFEYYKLNNDGLSPQRKLELLGHVEKNYVRLQFNPKYYSREDYEGYIKSLSK